MPLPAYSTTCPVPPAVPILAMMARITSLAGDAEAELAVDRDAHGLGLASATRSAWPDVRHFRRADAEGEAPSAPCVDVWLSPHTSVTPGSVMPCSGPTTCTMPWRRRRY